MQTVSCPNCGAPVEFKSHASVVAVCGFCSTTVMKDADAVKDLGRMSAVLEDFTRLQIGTSGSAYGRPFTVVGRSQLKYAAGMWNEWYLLFDDGGTGWLGDSSGLYTLTTEIPASGALPPFAELSPGRQYAINGERFMVAEVRTAACVGGQGELPSRSARAGRRAWRTSAATPPSSPSTIRMRKKAARPPCTKAAPSPWRACSANCCATMNRSRKARDVTGAAFPRSSAPPAATASSTCPA